MSNNKYLNKIYLPVIILLISVFIGYFLVWKGKPPFLNKQDTSPAAIQSNGQNFSSIDQPLETKFAALSKAGNSSCSATFRDAISQMPDSARLQGSCCSPMSLHRYKEQVKGLKKYSDISEIPSDPYDIEASLAQKLQSYFDVQLTEQEQKEYDFAMQNSNEKGPCCCKCWRWFVYGGLGKYLIREKGFTGEQVTEIWNLSDGCGGEGDHVNHSS